MNEKTIIPPPDWEALIDQIAKEIVEERSPARILQVRAKLYDLLTHCIPATTILKVSMRICPQISSCDILLTNLDPDLQVDAKN